MGNIEVNTGKLSQQTQNISLCIGRIEDISNSISKLKVKPFTTELEFKYENEIATAFNKSKVNLSLIRKELENLNLFLINAINFYEEAEKNIKRSIKEIDENKIYAYGFIEKYSQFNKNDNKNDNKKWYEKIMDFVKTGFDITSIFESIYLIYNSFYGKEFWKNSVFYDSGNIIFSIKDETLNASNIGKFLNWLPVVGVGVNFFSQATRSYKKYSEDGVMDSNDYAELLIDSAIYGIGHFPSAVMSLTGLNIFGLPQIYDEWIDNSGYLEMSSEGYKILGREIGEKLGNYYLVIRDVYDELKDNPYTKFKPLVKTIKSEIFDKVFN